MIEAPRSTILFNRGDRAHGFYLLLEGQVKLGVISPQGDEKTIGLIESGQSFGEAVLFLERSFPIYGQVTRDTKLLLISRDAIFNILDNDVMVVRRMLAALASYNHKLINDIETISLQNSTQRLIGYLLQIISESDDPTQIRLPANKLIIASMLNITPETFSRTMYKLESAELISVNGKDVGIIDVDGLRNFE